MSLGTSKRAEKRDKLFVAALKVMGEQGFKDASVAEIAKEAGVTRSVFYYYFESKADLVEKMMKNGNDLMFNEYNEAVTPGMSAEEMLHAIAHATYDVIFESPAICKFAFSEVWHQNEEWRPVLGEGLHEVISVFAELIEQGQEEGVFEQSLNVSFASQMVFSAVATTAAAFAEGYIENEEGHDIGEQVVDFICRGLSPNPAAKQIR